MPFYTPTPFVNFQYTPDKTPSMGQAYLMAQQKWADQEYQKQLRENKLAQQQQALQANQNALDEASLEKELGQVYQSSLQNGLDNRTAMLEVLKLAYNKGGMAYGEKQRKEASLKAKEYLQEASAVKDEKAKKELLQSASDFIYVGSHGKINLTPEQLEKPEAFKNYLKEGLLVQIGDKGTVKKQVLDPQMREVKLEKERAAINKDRTYQTLNRLKVNQLNEEMNHKKVLQNLYKEVARRAIKEKWTPEQKTQVLQSALEQNGFAEKAAKLNDKSADTLKNLNIELKKLELEKKKKEKQEKAIQRAYKEYDRSNKAEGDLNKLYAKYKSYEQTDTAPTKEDISALKGLAIIGLAQPKNVKATLRLLKKEIKKAQNRKKVAYKYLQNKGEDLSYFNQQPDNQEEQSTSKTPQPVQTSQQQQPVNGLRLFMKQRGL